MKRHVIFLALLLLTIVISTCKKNDDPPDVSNKLEFGNNSFDTISYREITVTSNLTAIGQNIIKQHGHCWATEENPTVSNSRSELGVMTAAGSFTSNMTDLTPNNRYYIRPYVTTNAQTIYGSQIEKSTLKTGRPLVTTNSVTDITTISAICGGTVVSDSGMAVTSRGVCWNISGNPSLTHFNGYSSDGSGTGHFTSILAGLTLKQNYYLIAYAINASDTSYGAIQNFETLCDTPAIVTGWFEDIAKTTLKIVNNQITNDGGCVIIDRGVCWNRTGNPTLDDCDNHTVDGNGTGSFTSSVTGLIPGTKYWFRAYAKNEDITGYGTEINGEMLFNCESSMTVTHNADSVAPITKTVTYGIVGTSISGSPKCWITQNLGADHEAFSTTDATEASAGWYWQFNRKQGYKHDGITRIPSTAFIIPIEENSDWLSANDPCKSLLGGDWRIPTFSEWNNADANCGWGNYEETFLSVLKLHAAGYLWGSLGQLDARGNSGSYFSSNQSSSNTSLVLYFGYYWSEVSDSMSKEGGTTLRCLKDQNAQ